MSSKNAIADAFARIESWMEREAPLLAENLAPGASEAQLDAFETTLGCRLPPDLRLLWSIHNGQRDEQNGFYESLDLLSTDLARADRSTLDLPLAFLRENEASDRERAEMTEAELRSDKWILLASRGYDGVAVNAESGRVFDVAKDVPPFSLAANSVEQWLVAYADVVAADGYEVEEGFGDYFLSRRNLEAERRADESRRAREAEAQRRASTPAADLLREAIAKNDTGLSEEVVRNAQKDNAAKAEIVALLFSGAASPSFIAETVRTMLHTLNLSAAEWLVVSEGGARVGNNAVRDIARKKAQAV